MIFITGNQGKSRILQDILDNNSDSFVLLIGNNVPKTIEGNNVYYCNDDPKLCILNGIVETKKDDNFHGGYFIIYINKHKSAFNEKFYDMLKTNEAYIGYNKGIIFMCME